MASTSAPTAERRSLEDEFGGAAGEVTCDVCEPPKQRAKKSCLLCLNSFCATHLENHYTTERLKGHKLVEPLEDLDARACLEHGLPLELYSRTRQICICVCCMGDGQEDGQEDVVSTEYEWDKKKGELDEIKAEFQQKIHGRKMKLDEIDAALRSIKDKLGDELGDTEAVFTAMFTILKEAKTRMLQPIEEKKQVVENEAEYLSNELRAEIEELQMNISKMDDISALENRIFFLQSYPTPPDPKKITDKEVKLNTSLSLGTFRKTMATMMEKLQQELETLTSIELERVPEFTVDVKLDPTTAHRRLVFSEDEKEVMDGGKDQGVDDTPGRFELFDGVVARDSLTSRRSYWEVETYCAAHLETHYQREDLGRHLLISVVKNMEGSVCKLHGRRLEKFCRSDRTCICAMCAQTEHRGHHLVSVSREAAKMKVSLKRRKTKLQQEIQERRSEADKIKLSAELGRENPKETQSKELVEQLEEEIDELQRRSAELEQLEQAEDNVHFLRRFLHAS